MIKIKDESVILSLDSGQKFDLPFLWLRDNCQCDECRITETEEKQFLLHKVPVDLTPDNVQIIDERIHISWPDSHQSVIDIDKIINAGNKRYPEHEPWPKNFIPNKYDWREFLEDKKYAADTLKNFVKYGVIILDNAPTEPYSLELLSKRFGPIHETLFERIHNVSVTGHVYNVAHTAKAEAPLIQCDSEGKVESFRFSNQLMQMIDPNKKDLKEFYKAYHEVSKRIYDDKYRSIFRLNSGEVLIVASLRVLHARESFIPSGKRHLQDAYFVYDNAANNIVLLSN